MENRQRAARVALALALAVAAAWIGLAFLPAILWAGVVAVAVDPLRRRFLQRYPGRIETVSILLTAAIALIVVVPLAIGLTRGVIELQSLATWYAGVGAKGIPVPAWISHLPYGAERLTSWWQTNLATPGGAAAQMHRFDTAALIAHSKVLGHDVLHRVILFGFTMMTLFFLLRDREAVVKQLDVGAQRAFGDAGPRVGAQILASVRGTIDGLVLVGLAEGVIMSIAYVVAGVPHPILLGLLAGIGGMVPFGLMIFMLVALFLLLIKGAIVTAVVLGIFGFVLNFAADHFVRPALIGGTTRLPFVWVLVGILGGVETIGLLGLFVGPAVMAAFILVWRDFVAKPAVEVDESLPAPVE